MTTNAVSAVHVKVEPGPGPLALNAPQIPTAVANGGLRWEDLDDPASPVLAPDTRTSACHIHHHFTRR